MENQPETLAHVAARGARGGQRRRHRRRVLWWAPEYEVQREVTAGTTASLSPFGRH